MMKLPRHIAAESAMWAQLTCLGSCCNTSTALLAARRCAKSSLSPLPHSAATCVWALPCYIRSLHCHHIASSSPPQF
jgi:hypothetical protein